MVFFCLYIRRMMAKPTAASAAATVMTKNTMTCPSIEPADLAKVMKTRFAAFSMISTDMNCVIKSFFTKKAIMPRKNRTMLKIKK